MRRLLIALAVLLTVAAWWGAATTAGPVSTTVAPDADDQPQEPDPDEPVIDADDLPTGTVDPGPIAPDRLDGPPPVLVGGNGADLTLSAWTTCWTNFCADGVPPDDDDLLLVVGDDPLVVEFPIEGWSFTANGRSLETECGREQTVDLESTGPTTFELAPFGLGGDRAINLFGFGPGGDVIVSFRWQTTVDGAFPTPSATLSLLALHDGEIDSYGVEFPVRDLATTPDTVTASVVVTAADGASTTIDLEGGEIGCTGEGSLYFTAGLDKGLAAAALGDAPFTYDVTLVIDGVTHTAHHTWPDDVEVACAHCVPLTFDPPLPAMGDA